MVFSWGSTKLTGKTAQIWLIARQQFVGVAKNLSRSEASLCLRCNFEIYEAAKQED